MRFDNFTYVQLLSDTVSFDKKLNKKLLPISNSFRLKKAKQVDEAEKQAKVSRSKSSQNQEEEINIDKFYKRIDSVDDDITDILKRYNIRGYSKDPDEQNKSPRSSSPSRLIYNPNIINTGSFEFDEMQHQSTPTVTTSENNIYLNSTLTKSTDSISARIDFNDLILDLNLCSPSPRQTASTNINSHSPASTSRGTLAVVQVPEPKADYYHNKARYPLISRAIYKPHSYDNLNSTRENFNDGSTTHRDCSCFVNNDETSHFKRHSYNSLRISSNSTKPVSYSCNLDSASLESSRTNTARLNPDYNPKTSAWSANVALKTTTIVPKDNNSTHKNLIKERRSYFIYHFTN